MVCTNVIGYFKMGSCVCLPSDMSHLCPKWGLLLSSGKKRYGAEMHPICRSAWTWLVSKKWTFAVGMHQNLGKSVYSCSPSLSRLSHFCCVMQDGHTYSGQIYKLTMRKIIQIVLYKEPWWLWGCESRACSQMTVGEEPRRWHTCLTTWTIISLGLHVFRESCWKKLQDLCHWISPRVLEGRCL